MDKAAREKEAITNVIEHFIENEQARRLLLDIWDVVQAWDDAEDGDVNPQTSRAFRLSNVDLPTNPLYGPFGTAFQIQQMYLKWEAANAFERANMPELLHKSYMLRAEYYQLIVNMVCFFEGVEQAALKAPDIWLCYGETYQTYESELCLVQSSEQSAGA